MIFYTIFFIIAFQFQQATALYDAYKFVHSTCLNINTTAVFYQENPKIAIGCSDGIILVYNKNQFLLTLTGHNHTIIHLAWISQYLISVDKSGLTLVRNISTYNTLIKYPFKTLKWQLALVLKLLLVVRIGMISTFKISDLSFSRTYISVTGQFIGMIYSRHDGGNYLYTFDLNHRYRYWVYSGECVPYTLNYTPIFIDSNPTIDQQVILTNASDFEFMNSFVPIKWNQFIFLNTKFMNKVNFRKKIHRSFNIMIIKIKFDLNLQILFLYVSYKSYSSLGLKKIFYADNGKQLFGAVGKTLVAYNQHASDIQFQFQGWDCQLAHISSNIGLMVGSDICGKIWIFIQKNNTLSILGIIIVIIFGILICAIIALAARQQIKRKRMNRQQVTWSIIFCCRNITVMIVQVIRRKKTKHISFDRQHQNHHYGLIT